MKPSVTDFVIGTLFLVVAAIGAAQLFLIHQRFESSDSFLPLVGIGLGLLYLVGMGIRFAFIGWDEEASA